MSVNNHNNFQGFLAKIALAKLDQDLKRQAAKVFEMESAIRYEKYKQDFTSSLMVLLERVDLSRRELNHVLFRVEEATPDELLQKIKFVTDRMGESPDPAKQFKSRIRSKSL